MSNTSMATIPDLPAYLQVGAEAARARNLAAMGGIKAGGFPRISQGGGKFHLIEGDNKTLITSPERPDLPAMELEVVVVGFNPFVSKTFYQGDWEPGDADEPDCSSDNGQVPDPGVPAPQCSNCASCPQNAWGSKISKHNGKQIKACSDNKRLVVVNAHSIPNGPAISLTITPGALREWAEYVRLLDAKGIEISSVVTRVQFDPAVTFPKLLFKFGRYLLPEELAAVRLRESGDDVRLIASPKSSAPVAPTQAPAAPVYTPPAAPAAPVYTPPPAPVYTAPVEVPPVYQTEDIYAGIPENIAAAIKAVGGPDSPGGSVLMTQFKPVAAPAPAPVDPFAGLADFVKVAVESAGGWESDAGFGVYAALGGTVQRPAAAATEEKKTRKRRTQAEMAADKAAAAAGLPAAPVVHTVAQPAPQPVQQPAPQPVQAPTPAPSYAAPAQGNVSSDLDALLAQAMATPTA